MSFSSSRRALVALALTLLVSSIARAQDAPSSTTEKPTTLPSVKVSAPSSSRTKPDFPATQVSNPAEKIQATVNAVNVEDAAKYLPSIFTRKRN